MYHFEKLDTPQKVFDYVVMKVYEQGCKSVDSLSCAYRGNNNTKCAIGHLIPSNLYRKEFEGRSIAGNRFLPLIKSERFKSFLVTNLQLLKELQRAHDVTFPPPGSSFRSIFLQRANDVAMEFNLLPYKPTKFYKDN